MSRRPAILLAALVFVSGENAVAQTDSTTRRPFTFAVLGHVRGNRDGALNPKLAELIERVRMTNPDFVLLTGDIIWGEVDTVPRDTAEVRRQWDAIDSVLGHLEVPVFRVPGNHDISDLRTRDLYYQRYGRVPQVIERFGSRLILLASPWIPADGDTVARAITRPVALDSSQAAWLRAELARKGDWDHTFLAMHHILWWNTNAPWWRELHPTVAQSGVRMVFAGDYGPLKFSRVTRDSVLYLQSSMEGIMSVEALRRFETGRILSAQFDNFLVVRVNQDTAKVEVRTLGEWSSPQFEPAFYQAMMPQPQPTGWRRRIAEWTSPRKLAALGVVALFAFGIGMLLGRRSGAGARSDG
jgi:hypothetical protein